MPDESRGRIPIWTDWSLATLVFTASLAIYLRTLIPTLLLGDGAEFQVLGDQLGLGHTTGYPVYLLLVKAVTLLPMKDIAYRANLSSALFASLTLAGIYGICRLLGSAPLTALLGPAALALTPLFWWHAVMAEVYTAAAAFITCVLLLVLIWRQTGNTWWLFYAGILGGLGLGVHGMTILIAPGVGLYLLLYCWRDRTWQQVWSKAARGAFLGILLWVAVFWAFDHHAPPANNLDVSIRYNLDVWDIDPAEFDSNFLIRFWYVASGRMFHETMVRTGDEMIRSQWGAYQAALQEMFPAWILALAVVGQLGLLVYPQPSYAGEKPWLRWREGQMLLLAFLVMMAFVLTYEIGDIFVFYIPTFVPLAILSSVGASCLIEITTRGLGKIAMLQGRPLAALKGLAALVLIGFAIHFYDPALLDSWNAEKITFLDKSAYRDYPYPVGNPDWPHAYSAQIVRNIADHAIVITDWSLVYPILYVAHVEQGRLGISAHEVYSSLWDIEPSQMTIDYMRANLYRRPVYVTHIWDNLRDEFLFRQVPGVDLWLIYANKEISP
jgi:hypothetical protein